jgi:hypothetical protein
MAEQDKDTLSPASKEPAEGSRQPGQGGGAAGGPMDKSHLGAGGDPVEGKPDKKPG